MSPFLVKLKGIQTLKIEENKWDYILEQVKKSHVLFCVLRQVWGWVAVEPV